eukprot:scaffold868_cov189-Ochromonas_danica.AAC.3
MSGGVLGIFQKNMSKDQIVAAQCIAAVEFRQCGDGRKRSGGSHREEAFVTSHTFFCTGQVTSREEGESAALHCTAQQDAGGGAGGGGLVVCVRDDLHLCLSRDQGKCRRVVVTSWEEEDRSLPLLRLLLQQVLSAVHQVKEGNEKGYARVDSVLYTTLKIQVRSGDEKKNSVYLSITVCPCDPLVEDSMECC